MQRGSAFLPALLILASSAAPVAAQVSVSGNAIGPPNKGGIESHSRWFSQVPYQPKRVSSQQADILGAWSAPQYVGMQAVHAALLPDDPDQSGFPQKFKVLIANGSSNRDPMGVILGGAHGGIDNRPFSVINNVGVWRPDSQNGNGFRFQRINPSPYPPLDYPDLATPIPGGKPSRGNATNPPTNNSEIDLFCGGHTHLPNGNLLFAGGTKTYEDDFRGAKLAWLFDWHREKFVNIKDITNAATDDFLDGKYSVALRYNPFDRSQTAKFEAHGQGLEDGHWYPTLVQLSDGNIAILSGLTHNKYHVSSSKVELYDWRTNRILSADFRPGMGGDIGKFYNADVKDPHTHDSTAWGLYARAHLMPNGELLLSGDDAGYGNRDSKETAWLALDVKDKMLRLKFRRGPLRREVSRYYPAVVYDPRYEPASATSPGRSGVIHIAGQVGLNDLANGPRQDRYDNSDERVAGVKSSMSYFEYDPADATGGRYHLFKHWLGEEKTRPLTDSNPNATELLDDSRINHLAVVLPTRQILVVGGGNYGYRLPVLHPQLLTPVKPSKTAPSGWALAKMNPHQMPRLYHSTALLLPDGRVWLGGGNAYRAQGVRPPSGDELERVKRLLRGERLTRQERTQLRSYVPLMKQNVFPTPDLQLTLLADPRYDYPGKQIALYNLDSEKDLPGNRVLSEQHHVEIFSPPYMFQDGGRPRVTESPRTLAYDDTFQLSIENIGDGNIADFEVNLVKPGSVTHGMDMGQRLIPLRIVARVGNRFTVRAPQAPETHPQHGRQYFDHTPGFYMLFFIDKTKARQEPIWLSAGVPSTARWVRLTSQPAHR